MSEADRDRGTMTNDALSAVESAIDAIRNELEAKCEIVAGDKTITEDDVREAICLLFDGRLRDAAIEGIDGEYC